VPLSSPPLSLRFPDSVKQPPAAGSVGLSGGVWDGVPSHRVGVSRSCVLESGTFSFVRGKGKVQFTTHNNVAQSGGDEVNQS
jgi:hypothetical protein